LFSDGTGGLNFSPLQSSVALLLEEAQHGHIIKRSMLTAQAKNEILIRGVLDSVRMALPPGLDVRDVVPSPRPADAAAHMHLQIGSCGDPVADDLMVSDVSMIERLCADALHLAEFNRTVLAGTTALVVRESGMAGAEELAHLGVVATGTALDDHARGRASVPTATTIWLCHPNLVPGGEGGGGAKEGGAHLPAGGLESDDMLHSALTLKRDVTVEVHDHHGAGEYGSRIEAVAGGAERDGKNFFTTSMQHAPAQQLHTVTYRPLVHQSRDESSNSSSTMRGEAMHRHAVRAVVQYVTHPVPGASDGSGASAALPIAHSALLDRFAAKLLEAHVLAVAGLCVHGTLPMLRECGGDIGSRMELQLTGMAAQRTQMPLLNVPRNGGDSSGSDRVVSSGPIPQTLAVLSSVLCAIIQEGAMDDGPIGTQAHTALTRNLGTASGASISAVLGGAVRAAVLQFDDPRHDMHTQGHNHRLFGDVLQGAVWPVQQGGGVAHVADGVVRCELERFLAVTQPYQTLHSHGHDLSAPFTRAPSSHKVIR
jgi:hypothetical protein